MLKMAMKASASRDGSKDMYTFWSVFIPLLVKIVVLKPAGIPKQIKLISPGRLSGESRDEQMPCFDV
jgi:hypothetical protein